MPTVTLVATVRDESPAIGSFIAAVERQTRRPEQVVVVDGGSRDDTVAQLRRWAERSALSVAVHEAPGSTISEGRNLAIRRARGEVIAVTDAGATADARWLELLCRPFDDPSVGAVGGFYRAGGESWFARCLTTVITPQLPEIDPETFLPSSRSVAFRRSAWEQVGGYPEWLEHCEDLVFDLALRDAGVHMVFEPRAVVVWNGRSSLRAFARQYFLYARGDGHALLWPRRHAARYGASLGGAWLLARARRQPAAAVALAVGAAFHFSTYWRRLSRSPIPGPAGSRARAFALVPVIVATGDVAKMAGYATGRVQRARSGRLRVAAARRRPR